MKRTGIILTVATVAGLVSGVAFADGALVVGQPGNIATNGVAVGLAVSYNNSSDAIRAATRECKTSKVKASTAALCRTVSNFSGQCAAIAMDMKPATPGFGWAVAGNLAAARERALRNCQATAGARKASCKIALAQCDVVRTSAAGSTTPSGNLPPPPQSSGWAYAFSASGAIAHGSTGYDGPDATLIAGGISGAGGSGDVGANSNYSAGGYSSASESSHGDSSSAGSGSHGSSCAGAGC
jgi:Domain of unknown function (DUF4189)